MNKTARLGLMQPSDTDPFTPTDFVNTFKQLDLYPGIQPIANYAALPKGLTSGQNGLQFLSMDNGAQWYWYQPVSTTGGVWKRSNSVGYLGYLGTTATTTSATTDTAASPLTGVLSTTCPGGRSVMVTAYIGGMTNNTANGGTMFMLFHNGSNTPTTYFASTDGGTTAHAGASLSYLLRSPAANSVHTWQLKIRTAAGGTSSTWNSGQLVVFEI